jgi:hypothetical protein
MSDLTVKIKTDQENPETLELIAQSIITIAELAEKINNSRLQRRLIVLMIQDIAGSQNLSMGEINLVLDTIPKIKEKFLKSLPKKK